MRNDERKKDKNDLQFRAKVFALRIIRFFPTLPKSTEAQVVGLQLLRSGTSVGAQYREAIRARSRAEFVSKVESGLQELEETVYWLELLSDSHISNGKLVLELQKEADELMVPLVSSAKTAKNSR